MWVLKHKCTFWNTNAGNAWGVFSSSLEPASAAAGALKAEIFVCVCFLVWQTIRLCVRETPTTVKQRPKATNQSNKVFTCVFVFVFVLPSGVAPLSLHLFVGELLGVVLFGDFGVFLGFDLLLLSSAFCCHAFVCCCCTLILLWKWLLVCCCVCLLCAQQRQTKVTNERQANVYLRFFLGFDLRLLSPPPPAAAALLLIIFGHD